MDLYLRVFIWGIAVVILSVAIPKNAPEFRMIILLCGIVLIGWFSLSLLDSIFQFIRNLSTIGEISGNYVSVLLKITGICILTQICVPICTDSGNASIGKMLQIASNAIVLYLGLPIFESILSILQDLLGKAF